MDERLKRRTEEREAERKYEGDVVYEVWRAGRNSDNMDTDRIRDHFRDGDPSDLAARDEIRRQDQRREALREQEEEEDEQEQDTED
jgi:hypothetical protein